VPRSRLTRLARRLAAPALACAALLALPAGASAVETSCANADLQPTAATVGAVREAVLCMHNELRAEEGLPRLRENARLESAAERHSASMVARRFFDHTTPAGVTMTDRIERSRYMRPGDSWTIGENLAWGSGMRSTPREVVAAWMASKGHRANVLRRSFREIGIGIEIGTPVELGPAVSGATYTADFGVRR
jgi:uncharacterized protein YkwD